MTWAKLLRRLDRSEACRSEYVSMSMPPGTNSETIGELTIDSAATPNKDSIFLH